ncbi:MAG: Gfo/Idh/MocA family protein [Pseudonocardia sp.]
MTRVLRAGVVGCGNVAGNHAAAQAGGVQLGVLFQRRFWPAAQRIRRAIDDGTLGRPILGHTSVLLHREPEYYYTGAAWRGTWATDGGGVLMTQAVHNVDLLQWFATVGLAEYPEGSTARIDVWAVPGAAAVADPFGGGLTGDLDLAAINGGLAPFHALQIADFTAAVREGREPAVTGREAAKSLAILTALYRSAASGLPEAVPQLTKETSA